MSLMGYTEDDLLQMKACLNLAVRNPNLSKKVIEGLAKANDLIDGLLVEGRV